MTEKMTLKSDVDDALTILGYGRWQIPFFLINFLAFFLNAICMAGATLFSVPLPFRCFSSLHFIPLQPTTNTTNTNTTIAPAQPSTVIYDNKCSGFNNATLASPASVFSKTDLSSCPFVEYDHSIFPSTVISEFNLVCEKSSLRPLFQICECVGVLLGSHIGGAISDKYGRKTSIIAGTVWNGVVTVMMAVCPWYSGVLITRLFVGIGISTILQSSISLGQETTPSRYRSYTGMLSGLGFSISLALFPGIGYFVRPWRHLLLAASSVLLLMMPLLYVVEESPRWLAQNGRENEAADALKRAARYNHVTLTPELVATLRKIKAGSKNKVGKDDKKVPPKTGLRKCLEQCRHYLQHRMMRRILFVAPIMWYMQGILYHGIILNANNFTSNDPFMYLAMIGMLEIICIILATPVTVYIGRRVISAILLFTSGILLLLDLAVPAEMKWIKWIFMMTAFFLSSAAFQILFMYTPELFPTFMRSRGFGFMISVGSLGMITAPIITDLLIQKIWWGVNAACGLAGILASLSITFLPETRNLPLPETVQDVETRGLGNMRKPDSSVTQEKNVQLETRSHPQPEQLHDQDSQTYHVETNGI